MKWGLFFITAVIGFIIILFQWPQMKQHPKRDKAALIVLLSIGLILSMFDLPQIKGPAQFREELFKPFGKYMQK